MFCVAPDGLVRVVFEMHMKNVRTAQHRSFSQEMARALAYGCVLGALGLACDRGAKQGEVAVAEPPAANPSAAPVSPNPGAPTPDSPSPAPQQADAASGAPTPAAGKPSFSEEAFELSLQASGTVAVGKPAEARVVLVAKSGYKVNDQYPFKLTLSDAPGLEFPAKVVTRDAMTLEKTQGIMKVAFTPKSAGDHALSGRFAFSVCTEERCLIEKRDLTLTVSAK